MGARSGDVTYDGRALIINGTRRLLFSGSIHYPRSPPKKWPYLIAKAKEGGLDYKFRGRLNLVRFIKQVQARGLYVSLRIGPFIESEWKYGGLPFWLHDVPGIVFRSDNEAFKAGACLQTHTISSSINLAIPCQINKGVTEGLFASQGGPIIITQNENEYENVEAAFGGRGPSYVRWAASMAVGLRTGVPWMMCKQSDAPDPVINTCNGMNCGKTFLGPNSPKKPALWTENWTQRFQVYGEDPRPRSAEDIAFAVALFIGKKNGSFVSAGYGERTAEPVQYLNRSQQWEASTEESNIISKASFVAKGLLEQMSTTKDVTDYLWCTTSYNQRSQQDGQITLHVDSLARVLHVLVNGELLGTVHGKNGGEPPVFDKPILLKEGQNNISLLSVMVGLPDSGEKSFAGIQHVRIQGTGNLSRDLTYELWRSVISRSHIMHQPVVSYPKKPLIWYKTRFDAPQGTDPVALNLTNMGKGEVWINGESIGRYWASFKAPSGKPSQSLYHVPRSFLKPSNNLLLLFEEMGGDPRSITVDAISVARVCGHACLGKEKCSIPVSASRFRGVPCPGITKPLLVVAECS
ncbi:hypothetical protein OPV22_000041 [Ensete ventricosum]|uniref:beta-galactosidase n=1 Tax=Ensete ventricosum TaxID=4639 RepID=A0AAV8RM75_ENSVE|nr:hypothetical protein OPV22_000041 [Ensete ventricosum]